MKSANSNNIDPFKISQLVQEGKLSAIRCPHLTKKLRLKLQAKRTDTIFRNLYPVKSPVSLLAVLFTTLILSGFIILGCQGPVGPSGKDAEGVDVVPPTIVMLEPWPLSKVWDEIEIITSAVDNVAIKLVSFNIDGSTVFALEEPPYRTTIDLAGYESGWHYVSARAFDSGGNITDTPVVPINVGFSAGLKDTMFVSYHNNVLGSVWSIPDTARSTAFWTKFSVAKKCYLMRASIRLAAFISDTAKVAVEVWEGREFPVSIDTTIYLTNARVDTTLQERRIVFGSPGFRRDQDFFIMISLTNNSREDTLRIQADNGIPFWKRSGSRDDEGFHFLQSRYAREDNLYIDCILRYESAEGDTSGG